MTIKEIEELAGMPRANIRYYEEQGLLNPTRGANGYRDYSEEDLAVLKKVKLLRSLHMSLDEIKTLHTGQQVLSVALERQIQKLSVEKEETHKAQSVCETMYRDGTKYETLDSEKYLKNLNEGVLNTQVRNYGDTKESREDVIPRVQAPWRRFFARLLDEDIYYTLWYSFMLLVFQFRLENAGIGWGIVSFIMTLLLTIILEALQLHLFGTTVGKWILGLRVLDNYERKLSLSYALDRTRDVTFYGMGCRIPFVRLFRMWRSFVKCTDGKELQWEYGSRIVLKDKKKYRAVVYVAVEALLIGIIVLAHVLVEIPINRGTLTVAEFCENYRRLEKVYEISSKYSLDDNGEWQDKRKDDGTIVLNPFAVGGPPEFIFETDEDGNIDKISFVVKVEYPDGTPKERKQTITSCQEEMVLAVMSFVGAQEDIPMFSSVRKGMAEKIFACEFEDYDFTEAGVRVTCDVEWQGYQRAGSGTLWSIDDGASYYYMEFSMSIQN